MALELEENWLTTLTLPKNPAPFTPSIIDALTEILSRRKVDDWLILDPFAGVGRIHLLPGQTLGVEIQHRWAIQGDGPMVVANALKLPFRDNTFDAVITSCTYGNRLADHHVNKDVCSQCRNREDLRPTCSKCNGSGLSHRRTYRHYYGEDLHPDNSGLFQWGTKYRQFHAAAWAEAYRVLKPFPESEGGLLILNAANHIRQGHEEPVVSFHETCFSKMGMAFKGQEQVATPGYRYGQNGEKRTSGEKISIWQKSDFKAMVARARQNGWGLER